MIVDRIYHWARITPTKAALIHNDTVIDYLTLAKAIEAFRLILGRQVLPAGTTALVLVNNLADAWALVMALRSIGLTTIHVQSLLQAKALGLRDVSCVVTTAREQQTHDLAGNQFAGAKLVVVSRADLAATAVSHLPMLPLDRVQSGGHILYTSGTTGAYKKLVWDAEGEEARASARSAFYHLDGRSVAHILHYEQQTALGWKIPLSIWQVGACVVMDQRAVKFERLFGHAITKAFMISDAFRQLVQARHVDLDRSSLQCDLVVTGGVIGTATIEQAIAKFGDCLECCYGSTELTVPPLLSRVECPEDAHWLVPTVGRTIEVVDDSGGKCGAGQEGNLRILMSDLDNQGYLDDEEATPRMFRDGFFYPGDRAMQRADGRVRVLGRTEDVINIQGQKTAVGPIEQRIQHYLNVEEVCAFSALNDVGQDELVIALQADREPDREMLDVISREFGNFDKVRFTVLKTFPRTKSGTEKVLRTELRKIVFSESRQ